mmetsp:Transcript_67584/g.180645  ORF Transcript_67584/g.180645 Transcript_67584/m.180645 type:complete len:275 (-) Transcript_67584:1697-2521(-)
MTAPSVWPCAVELPLPNGLHGLAGHDAVELLLRQEVCLRENPHLALELAQDVDELGLRGRRVLPPRAPGEAAEDELGVLARETLLAQAHKDGLAGGAVAAVVEVVDGELDESRGGVVPVHHVAQPAVERLVVRLIVVVLARRAVVGRRRALPHEARLALGPLLVLAHRLEPAENAVAQLAPAVHGARALRLLHLVGLDDDSHDQVEQDHRVEHHKGHVEDGRALGVRLVDLREVDALAQKRREASVEGLRQVAQQPPQKANAEADRNGSQEGLH